MDNTSHWTTFPPHFDFFEREDRTIIVNMILADKIESIAEFALGTGIMPILLRKAGYKGKYVGTDLIENFINISKQHNPDEEIRCADLNKELPFADKSVEASMIFTGLGYLNDLEATLRELKRITSRYIYISQFNLLTDMGNNMRFLNGEGWGNQYNKDYFYRLLDKVGLGIAFECWITNGKDYQAMEGVTTSKTNHILKLYDNNPDTLVQAS